MIDTLAFSQVDNDGEILGRTKSNGHEYFCSQKVCNLMIWQHGTVLLFDIVQLPRIDKWPDSWLS